MFFPVCCYIRVLRQLKKQHDNYFPMLCLVTSRCYKGLIRLNTSLKWLFSMMCVRVFFYFFPLETIFLPDILLRFSSVVHFLKSFCIYSCCIGYVVFFFFIIIFRIFGKNGKIYGNDFIIFNFFSLCFVIWRKSQKSRRFKT